MSKAGDVLDGIFESARETFLEDGGHAAMFFMLRRGEVVTMGLLNGETRDERDSVIQQMAGTVADEGIDAVIVVCEVWEAVPDSASQALNRTERLTAMLASQLEDDLWLSAPILRTEKGVALGDTHRSTAHTMLFLEPIYRVWGRVVGTPQANN
jgi:hypothetical protein